MATGQEPERVEEVVTGGHHVRQIRRPTPDAHSVRRTAPLAGHGAAPDRCGGVSPSAPFAAPMGTEMMIERKRKEFAEDSRIMVVQGCTLQDGRLDVNVVWRPADA